GRARGRRPWDAEAALPLRARRSERWCARALELGGDRRRRCPRRFGGLLRRDRDRLVVPPERGHAHRARALPEGLEPDGLLLDGARRRRRPGPASAALARGRGAPSVELP